MTLLGMSAKEAGIPLIAKANAGVPQFIGTEIHYSGTPELMAQYVDLAANAGARIIGGCCGNTFGHVAAMHQALGHHEPGPRPDEAQVVAELGALQAPGAKGGHRVGGGSRRPRRE
jgi:5-methyltetrahydrofolate--homocysteine methyltransferase